MCQYETNGFINYEELAINVKNSFFERFQEVIDLTDQCIDLYLEQIKNIFVLPALNSSKVEVNFRVCGDIDYAFSFMGNVTIGINMNLFLVYDVKKIATLLISAYFCLVEGGSPSANEMEIFLQKISSCINRINFDLEQMPDIIELIKDGFYCDRAIKMNYSEASTIRQRLS